MSFGSKRANSHPDIKMNSDSEDASMTNRSDKKQRTKLSYPRASTACTNCRRRKIRCEAGEAGHEKCKSCFKLNKDCKFESVNASSPTGSRHASISRASAGLRLASASSSSSSPAISSRHTIDIHAAQHHGSMAVPPSYQMGLADSPGLKMESAISRYPEYGSQGMAPSWMSHDSTASGFSRNNNTTTTTTTKHGSWGAPYGRHDTTPTTPTFPSYNSHGHPHQQATHVAHPRQQAWATTTINTTTTTAPDSSAGGWASPYPPLTPSAFSPLTSAYVDRASGSKTPSSSTAVMPTAEMYPPIPTMDHHGGAPLSPPPTGSAQSASGPYGGWHTQQQQRQTYLPLKPESGNYFKQEAGGYPGAGGGWYGNGPEAVHGMPVADGYYAQR
ncbi:unnamed protein product [Discula destructiva]